MNLNHRKRLLFIWIVALVAACAPAAPPVPPAPSRPPEPPISELYGKLSEQGGYFDSDNLISNETSYLHALDDLRTKAVRGGAYIGVGPDQSFSYIAEIKPELAFIIDIRRDNMLQHLMFRSMFLRSTNRMDFLARLIGADIPGDIKRWTGKPIEEIVAVLDSAMRSPATFLRVSAEVVEDAKATGIPLSEADIATMIGFHHEFHQLGLQIRYTSKNRPPRLS